LKILEGGVMDEDIETIQARMQLQMVTSAEFKSPYKDPLGQVNRLYEYIKWCDVEFQEGSQSTWYSPDISICQSSGWGKSRIVRQLSALVPVLHLSYQGTVNKEYPETSYVWRSTKDPKA
jgi:hypothetical protein